MAGGFKVVYPVSRSTGALTRKLLLFELEHDRLFLIRLYLASVLYGRRPFTALLDNADGLISQPAFRRAADSLHIAHITFFVHDELNDHRTLDLIVHGFVGVTEVLVQITQPGCGSTGIFGLDLHLGKGLVVILRFFGGFHDAFAGIRYRRGCNTFILNTFLVHSTDLGIFQLLLFRWLFFFFYLIVLDDLGRGELGHFHLGRFNLGGRRRGRLVLLLLLHLFQLHILHHRARLLIAIIHVRQEIGDKEQHDHRSGADKGIDQALIIGPAQIISTVLLIPTLEDDVEDVGG